MPQQPSLTVILSNYYFRLIAGSICVTLKGSFIVQIGQDHLWGSLYVIECSFDRPCSRVRTLLWFLLFWLLWSDHTPPLRWECQAIIPSFPAVTLVLSHVMEVSCYHSLLGGYIANIVCTLLLWALLPSLGVNTSRYLISAQNVKFFCIDF